MLIMSLGWGLGRGLIKNRIEIEILGIEILENGKCGCGCRI